MPSPDRSTTQWPPRSPFQALLSSPGGRKKWQDHRSSRTEERSPSPSPMRKQNSSSRTLQNILDTAGDDDEDEEDEETLQLKLQEIETRLKLKRLQQKAKNEPQIQRERATSPRKAAAPRHSLLHPNIEVPVSPVRVERRPVEQVSPARQRLGLNDPFRAQDVSLKRARPQTNASGSLRRAPPAEDAPRPKSFAERLMETKEREEKREARKERLEQARSTAFGQNHSPVPQMESKTRPKSLAGLPQPQPSVGVKRSTSARTSGTARAPSAIQKEPKVKDKDIADSGYDPFSQIHLKKRNISHSVVAREMEGKEIYPLTRLLKEVKSPNYDPPDCEADYVVFAVLASKSSPLDQAPTHKKIDSYEDNTEAPRNKFMVLHLCDLQWEVDLFLFGSAFNQFWKLTPGTLLAILNPAIMPPKGKQHNGRFSLKLGSSDDAVMEIGVARDLGFCISLKKDGHQCHAWVDNRKTEVCDYHISLQVQKSRANRMEVNTMFRGMDSCDDSDKPWRRRRVVDKTDNDQPRKRSGGQFYQEYGMVYSVKSGLGMSAASLLDADDTDALHNMTTEEASRKRLAAAQRDRDITAKLSSSGRGVGAEYLRASQGSSSHLTPGQRASAADEARNALFSKPTAVELGLGANKASEAHLSPAKDRKRHFGLGEMSATTARARDLPLGWGGAKRVGLAPPLRKPRASTPEEGQTTLRVPISAVAVNDNGSNRSGVTSGGDGGSELGTRFGLVRPRSQGSSIRSSGSTSPVKKRARFALAKGIREPGRESLPSALGIGNGSAQEVHDNDYDDDDDGLDIV